jgi:hypothetical protein
VSFNSSSTFEGRFVRETRKHKGASEKAIITGFSQVSSPVWAGSTIFGRTLIQCI